MKVLKVLILFVFISFFLILLGLVYSYKNSISKQGEIGLATGEYIFETNIYPDVLSSYFFEKYERHSLYQTQIESPEPYLFFINASYDLSLSESGLKTDRFKDVEDDLVCIGLSPARFDIYLERTNIFKGPSDYLLNKYKRFDYETLLKYCNDKVR